MKVFGTVQPFIETQETSFKIGRLVANYEFFNALFKFSDFNEYHIFCPTYANCRLTQDRIFSDAEISQNRKDRIKIYHISSLKNSLQKRTYDVFHLGGWGFFYPGFVHIRNLYASFSHNRRYALAERKGSDISRPETLRSAHNAV
jgi:hypothetical protein